MTNSNQQTQNEYVDQGFRERGKRPRRPKRRVAGEGAAILAFFLRGSYRLTTSYRERNMSSHTTLVLAASLGASVYLATMSGAGATMHGQADGPQGGSAGSMMDGSAMGEGLMMPSFDAARGRKLFASKGCVVCHSVNGVGGEDAPPLDAATMERPMNPFEFAAKMWRGADAMIYLQREELGEQIELTGDELSDIIAFPTVLKSNENSPWTMCR